MEGGGKFKDMWVLWWDLVQEGHTEGETKRSYWCFIGLRMEDVKVTKSPKNVVWKDGGVGKMGSDKG